MLVFLDKIGPTGDSLTVFLAKRRKKNFQTEPKTRMSGTDVEKLLQQFGFEMSAEVERIDFYDEKKPYYEFSNFYRPEKPLVYDGKEYQTSEHLYQCLKYKGPRASAADLAYAEVVRTAKSPSQCKLLAAQRVGGGYAWRVALNPTIQKSLDDGVKMRTDWDAVKVEQMEVVVMTKFEQDAHCRALLLSTGDKLLAEHTDRDGFWGTGGSARKGENHLGRVLMRVRERLRCREKEVKKEKAAEEVKKDDGETSKKRVSAEKADEEEEGALKAKKNKVCV